MKTRKPTKTTRTSTKKLRASRAPAKASFENETSVLREVARHLGEAPGELSIRRGSAPNGHGDAYEVTSGRQEYIVMRDEDTFEKAALAGVRSDIEDSPESFDPDFIQGHIDLKHLREELHSDVFDMRYEDLTDEAEKRPMRFLKDNDLDIEPPSDDLVLKWAEAMDKIHDDIVNLRREDPESQWITIGEEPTVRSSVIEEVADAQAKDQLSDPIGYLSDIYNKEEALKKAMEIGGIDVDKAAEEAVSTDGAAHFLCSYDGNYDTTKPSGFVVWRHN